MASQTPVLIRSVESDVDEACLRRRRIIDAANELLEEAGLEGLTIRAMLKRTGLARRAFYERFASKDDLVLAVFAETLKDAADFFGSQDQGDPIEQLRVIVVGLVMGSQEHSRVLGMRRVAAMVREHLRLAQTRPAELANALSPLLRIIADRIAAGIGTGQLRDCDPELQAQLIYNLVASTLHLDLMIEDSGGEGTNIRRRRLADEIWDFCRGGIVADPS
jgi:AcrR family transcriptional regulator